MRFAVGRNGRMLGLQRHRPARKWNDDGAADMQRVGVLHNTCCGVWLERRDGHLGWARNRMRSDVGRNGRVLGRHLLRIDNGKLVDAGRCARREWRNSRLGCGYSRVRCPFGRNGRMLGLQRRRPARKRNDDQLVDSRGRDLLKSRMVLPHVSIRCFRRALSNHRAYRRQRSLRSTRASASSAGVSARRSSSEPSPLRAVDP